MAKSTDTIKELHPEGYWKARYDLLYNMVVKNIEYSVPSWASNKYDYYLSFRIEAKTILQILEPEKIAEYEELTLKTIENRRKEENKNDM